MPPMPTRPLITLTTDFGTADGTVGAMIGVIKSICPEAEVFNMGADIPAHDIARGAWALLQAVPSFPRGAIHVAVVDPGVGSSRRGLLVTTARASFIGPDNGLLSWALRGESKPRYQALENPAYRIATVGVTFAGRDVFAPAAAHLAAGADPAAFGPAITDPVPLAWPEPRVKGMRIEGEILVVDHFGNLITNVPLALAMEACAAATIQVEPARNTGKQARPVSPRSAVAGQRAWRAPLVLSYDHIGARLGAVVNGLGLLEVAARQRSAAMVSGCGRGDRIVVCARKVRR